MLRSTKVISLLYSDHPGSGKSTFTVPKLYGRSDRRKYYFNGVDIADMKVRY